ncbi:MAG: hypothetical protein WC208_10545 [Gallionella sp.]|jgi:hypothetical protein
METIQGVRTKLVLVSQNHGSIRVPLAQTLNYTPKITERSINEFDNLEVAQVVTNFDGVDVTFDYLDSDSALVDAQFADVSPSSAVIIDDPSNYQKVYAYANMKGLESGLIFASVLIKNARAKGAPYTEPVKEEAKVTRDLSATNVLKIKGKAIQYCRMLASTPDVSIYQQAVPPNIEIDLFFSAGAPYVTTLPKTAVYYEGTSYDLLVLKNGDEVTTGYTMTSTTFTVAVSPATTDIWEVYYLYTDV